MQWKGTYEVKEKVGENEYRIAIRGKVKTYHVNLLKLYFYRKNRGLENQGSS